MSVIVQDIGRMLFLVLVFMCSASLFLGALALLWCIGSELRSIWYEWTKE